MTLFTKHTAITHELFNYFMLQKFQVDSYFHITRFV